MKRIALLTLAAATSLGAQQSIKPRPLGAVQATSRELLGLPTLARALPGGGVIVNDAARRRLLLLDPSLDGFSVIADSTSGSVNGYGQRPGALIPYIADSTLFLDATSGSFLVIDPAGKVVRVMSPPRPNDNGAIASLVNGFPGFDAKGRMVYRTSYRSQMQQTRDGQIQMSTPPDSAPLLRVDLDTRRADTVSHLRLARLTQSSISLPNGQALPVNMPVPLSPIDDWAVLSDGTIAVVRGRDYRVDFIQSDGTKRTSDKIAFDWKRLSDDDKLALIDSIQKARAAGPIAGGPQMITSFGGGDGTRIVMGGGGGRGEMITREVVTAAIGAAAPVPAGAPAAPAPAAVASAGSGSATSSGSAPAAAATAASNGNATPAANAAGAASGATAATANTAISMNIPAPALADIPDYMPAFTQSSARADADANLWIRTTKPGAEPGNIVYDVINNQGILVDRVDVPKGMQIVGFAKGGVVYLSQREGYGYRILKASVR